MALNGAYTQHLSPEMAGRAFRQVPKHGNGVFVPYKLEFLIELSLLVSKTNTGPQLLSRSLV